MYNIQSALSSTFRGVALDWRPRNMKKLHFNILNASSYRKWLFELLETG